MKKLTLSLLVAAMLAPAMASANQAGDIIVRAGTATVRPNARSDDVFGLGSFQADTNTQLGLTMAYMITDNIGIELLAATPFTHKVSLNGVGTIADVKQLPPTLMGQYYFDTSNKNLRPYLGLGLNYTGFFDGKFNDTGKSAGLSNLSLKNSWGVAGQAGLDYNLPNNWLINMSVWWIDMKTQVRFDAGTEHQNIDMRVDPFVFMFGVGYRF